MGLVSGKSGKASRPVTRVACVCSLHRLSEARHRFGALRSNDSVDQAAKVSMKRSTSVFTAAIDCSTRSMASMVSVADWLAWSAER